MNTINIRSRCHIMEDQPWSYGCQYPYQLHDERHAITAEEVEAIERTGRSSWQQYASIPTQWPGERFAVLPLMEGRPGATEPGEFPTQRAQPPKSKGGNLPGWTVRRTHLLDRRWTRRNEASCGSIAEYIEVVGFAAFGEVYDLPTTCKRCREVWERVKAEKERELKAA